MDSWFKTEQLGEGVIRITEPFVHEFYRANFYRILGRDFDIQFDFGIGILSLAEVSAADAHPVLAIASHAHVDHIGRFHEYSRRAGHRLEAHTFATLDDNGTVESWYRKQQRPVEQLPHPGWTIADYRLRPAPLTEMLEESDVVDLDNRKFTGGEFFSADAIYDDVPVDDVPTANIAAYLKTMRRLSELDIAIGHGGHGPSFDNKRMHEIARDYIASKGG
ncbi:MAG: Zn-dependent hydrolase, glyoxylase [Rhizobium sp.]|nr:Zn-dependent hydrolase, glyoxylase [Rhizobium sp.]